jgi:hypothetical protein
VILYGNFLAGLARILHLIMMIYLWIVIFRAILSWVNVCLAILFVDSFVVNSMAIYARHLLRGAEVSF